MALITKIVAWVMTNGAAVLGIIQGILKVVKELLTLIIDLVSLILPKEIETKVVNFIRAAINAIDAGLEFIKKWLLKL